MNFTRTVPNESLRQNRVISVEFMYVLFLFSGYIKQYLVFFGVEGVDFTLLVGGMLVFTVCLALVSARCQVAFPIQRIVALCIMLLFLISVLVSMLYTQSTNYYMSKLLNLGACVVAYFFPLFMKGFSYKNFLQQFENVSLVFVSIFILVFPLTYNFSGLETIQATYLVIGYLCGLNLLLVSQIHTRNKFIFSIFLVALVMSGARGAILFTMISFLIIYLFLAKKPNLKVRPKSLIVYPCFVLLLVTFVSNSDTSQKMMERTVNRTLVLFEGDGNVGSSAQIRINHINDSIAYIAESPVKGYGFGSYSIVTTGLDIRAYPHNSILEVWFELGLLGLLSFLGILIFHIGWSLGVSGVGVAVLMLYLFLNSLTSSSFAELKLLFGLFSVFLLAQTSKVKIEPFERKL